VCQRQRPARPSAWPPSALAGDILALWAAPTTTVADRKRPLRAVIESVQVTGLFRLYQAAGGKTERQCVTTSRPVQWFAVSHPSRRYPLDQMGVGQARPPPAVTIRKSCGAPPDIYGLTCTLTSSNHTISEYLPPAPSD